VCALLLAIPVGQHSRLPSISLGVEITLEATDASFVGRYPFFNVYYTLLNN
jgi:hypothetical protein